MGLRVAVTDTELLDDVIFRLRRASGWMEDGCDDAGQLVAELIHAGELLVEFTADLRRVLGG